jgi:xylulose-5-phosphate/fructose-6-phosphate phosphoketolase
MQVSQPETKPIAKERLEAIDRYWRAANYLSAGQIYLKENPLLEEPLASEHVKERLLGHWGTSPGLNLLYAHISRLIQDTGSKFLYITGPGHGGPALRACTWLEGCMSETYPSISHDRAGMHKLMREFSWPGGVPSHVSPPTPGSIHEGGELGYSLVHAYGAAFDNPDLIVACVVGDGEAETGPLAAAWHSNKFLNRERDGAVLPILHLNGYKISGPTVMGRMDNERLKSLFHGFGYQVRFVEGDDPEQVHRALWEALDWAHGEIVAKAELPMIIMRTPKGWTGPKVVDGKQVEGTFRSHQVPLADVVDNPAHLQILEQWLSSYRPDQLFDETGRPRPEVLEICPKGELRMGATPHANGGLLLKDLEMPDFTDYAIDVPAPGAVKGEATRQLGLFLRDVMKQNMTNFRVVCPDETASNRLSHLFEVTGRTWEQKIIDTDDDLSPDGRVMEVLSEHLCQGWLEGYLLTGRHGIFPCYEAFALIVDSMLNQHAKWLKACKELPWREPIASLNYLLTSHAWRQDHNGYSHQGPGFIESVLQKKASCARIYLPPDANCLLEVADHCLRSRDRVNLMVAGKQPMPQWLNKEEAKAHCEVGASIWEWASSGDGLPEVVLASSGDTPTLETLAAISLLRHYFPDLRIQMVNVVDLFTLVTPEIHSHGMSHDAFDTLFPPGIPILFAFHGHPMVIEELVFGRSGRERFFIRGYLEEGTTTTPFDMVVRNKISRYHLAREVVQRVPRLGNLGDELEAEWTGLLERHKGYIYENGKDLPEVLEWQWKT